MSESSGIDSVGGNNPKAYSNDLRVCVIETIEGGASRREAAELYGISPSMVVIWARRWKESGSFAAKPSGGSISPLEDHAEFLLGLVAEQPDSTLDEVIAAMSKARIAGSRTPQFGGSTNDTTSASKNTLLPSFILRPVRSRTRSEPIKNELSPLSRRTN